MAEASTTLPPATGAGDLSLSPAASTATPGAFSGWETLRVAVNQTVPAQLRAAEALRQQSARLIGG